MVDRLGSIRTSTRMARCVSSARDLVWIPGGAVEQTDLDHHSGQDRDGEEGDG